MRTQIMIFLASATIFAGPATAATFSGPRAEVRGGWDRTTLDASYDDGVFTFRDDAHKDGFNLGGEVGFDAALGTVAVAGAYAGVEFATTKECSEIYGDDEGCLKLGRNITIGGRLGAKVSPSVLVYAKGGYSNGQLRATYSNIDDPTLDFDEHSNRDGIHFGAGVEVAIGQNGYTRAEYVRTNYDGYKYSDPNLTLTLDGHRDQVLFGFGFRF